MNMEIIIITGLSGAGKTRAITYFEDMGYYCVDNMPPKLIPDFAEMMASRGAGMHMAVVTDIRSGVMFDELSDAIAKIREGGLKCRVLFLEANRDIIAKRYEESGRMHPLIMQYGTLDEAIAAEVDKLSLIRNSADYIIDSSALKVSELKEALVDLFYFGSEQTVTLIPARHGAILPSAQLNFDIRPYEDNDDAFKGLFKALTGLLPLYMNNGCDEVFVALACGDIARGTEYAEKLASSLTDCGISTGVCREYL